MSAQEQSTYVYKKYYQKSLNFLFPLLGFAKEETFRPQGCFLWWKNGPESIETLDLLVHYETEEKALFEMFEKKVLMKHAHFESCYSIKEGGKLYVFNLGREADTVNKFLNGKYSQFSEGVKKRILNYHGASQDKVARPGRVFHTALYPELYWEHVAKEISFDINELEKVGELCNVYDKKNETFEGTMLDKCEEVPKKQLSL